MRVPRPYPLPTIEEVCGTDTVAPYPRTPYPPYDPVRQRTPSTCSSQDSLTGSLFESLSTSSDPGDLALSEDEGEKDDASEKSDVSYGATINTDSFPPGERQTLGPISPRTPPSSHQREETVRLALRDFIHPQQSGQDSRTASAQQSNSGRKRARDSVTEGQPQSKFPRLTVDVGTTRTPAINDMIYTPTPVSPMRHFTDITAEKASAEGTLYRVTWRESWVHESRLPNIQSIRQTHLAIHGAPWAVLSGKASLN